MQLNSLSERLIRPILLMLAIIVLPLLRFASALEPPDTHPDTIVLPFGDLDTYALARFRDDNTRSYGIIFWDRFIITSVKSPSPTQSDLKFRERVLEQLSITPLNTPEHIESSGVTFCQHQPTDEEYSILVCELDRIYEGLTPVLMPFEREVDSFNQWLNSSTSSSVISAVADINEQNQLLIIPLSFDPRNYQSLPGWIVAEHDGSSFTATQTVTQLVLPGMSCLGQSSWPQQELMFLGFKPDRQIFQYNKPDGEQFLQIPFLPLEQVIHLVASSAGVSQHQANRWQFRTDGSATALAITTHDILKLFGEETDQSLEGYLCLSDCSTGTAPRGKGFCRTRKGKSSSFYVLEGRLVEWEFIQKEPLPDEAMHPETDSRCTVTYPVCFVAVAEVTGFGEVYDKEGCDIGDDLGPYSEYFIAIIESDKGATVDPEQPTLPVINNSNSTADYSGSPHIIVITNPGFTEPSQPSFIGGNDSHPPDLIPPDPVDNSSIDHQTLIIIIVVPAAGLTLVVVIASSACLYYIRKKRHSQAPEERHRLIEEDTSPPPPPDEGTVVIPMSTISGGASVSPVIRISQDQLFTVDRPRSNDIGTMLEPHSTTDNPNDPPALHAPPIEGIILIPPEERTPDTPSSVPKSRLPEDQQD
ncbi:hypothetical protein [Endozoicomonas arenosclerae]|uniref:hypothetical protein n=1 Tax=Endozoicomonas arenosclerae TaxID=1633495 RepID=UPI0007834A13|nr:hypothetical protein [Endozoicomonas arenosclerae]